MQCAIPQPRKLVRDCVNTVLFANKAHCLKPDSISSISSQYMYDAGAYIASVASVKPGSQYMYDTGAYIASVASVKLGSQYMYGTGAYIASIASIKLG